MTHIVTLDADGQHHPADFLKFLPVIQENPWALVVGCRVFPPEKTPPLSRFGRGFSNFWFRVQTGLILKDTQTGFRVYPVAALLGLKLRCPRYAFEVEVLVKAAWAGLDFQEVPVSVQYPPRAQRVSHFRLFRDNLSISILNTFLTLRAVLPFPHRRFRAAGEEREKISLWHPLQSIRILLHRKISRRDLALSVGVGVLVGTLPLVGLWTLTVLVTVSFFRLNKLAGLSASQISNFPLLPALCIELGHFLRQGRWLTEFSLVTLGYQAPQRLLEWLIGSLILGPLFGLLAGLLVFGLASLIQKEERGSNP